MRSMWTYCGTGVEMPFDTHGVSYFVQEAKWLFVFPMSFLWGTGGSAVKVKQPYDVSVAVAKCLHFCTRIRSAIKQGSRHLSDTKSAV